jgi:hypothetical protein
VGAPGGDPTRADPRGPPLAGLSCEPAPTGGAVSRRGGSPARGRRGWLAGAIPLALLASLPWPGGAGHEIPFYPSFYPQEIRVHVLAPAAAVKRLEAGTLQAYLGADPFRGRPLPPSLQAAVSLRGWVVVTWNTALPAWRDAGPRCDAARRLAGILLRRSGDYTAHPSPVTPYHPDLVWHADRIDTARAEARAESDRPLPATLRLRARGEVATRLLGRDGRATGPWDATVEDVDLDTLVAPHRIDVDGWLGPPWLKAGWFHAYLLGRDQVVDPAMRRDVDLLYERLTTGQAADLTERVALERRLVRRLGEGCERLVLGYLTRREVYNADFSRGIENVAIDAHAGLDTSIFVRTAKLKDFPWNGWLDVATPGRATSGWNPVAGFTADPTSRLVWAALSDPALLPSPTGGDWVPNRVSIEAATEEAGGVSGVSIPEDALLPETGTGLLKPVGPGQRAEVRLRYRVLGSAFHDGSRTSPADLLYPFALAFRWGAPGDHGPDHDAGLETGTALLRERLAGLRVTGSDTLVRNYGGDAKFVYPVHLVDVYLRHVGRERPDLAAIAPPWSTAPWHVLALSEEAARRGRGAFSRTEAARRGRPWLDLVRDAPTRATLLSTVDAWQAQATVPPALASLVTSTEAKARWTALREFARARGHVLVTNGPYQLVRWSPEGAGLGVFRDLTYPLGVGTYDRWATPRRAYVREVETRGDRLLVAADIEVVERVMRDVRVVRERLQERPTGIDPDDVPRCRFLVVGADGEVARAGVAPFVAEARFAVDLGGLPSGAYTVAIALSLGGNELDPEVKLIQYRAP